jgi:hypothetical protein
MQWPSKPSGRSPQTFSLRLVHRWPVFPLTHRAFSSRYGRCVSGNGRRPASGWLWCVPACDLAHEPAHECEFSTRVWNRCRPCMRIRGPGLFATDRPHSCPCSFVRMRVDLRVAGRRDNPPRTLSHAGRSCLPPVASFALTTARHRRAESLLLSILADDPAHALAASNLDAVRRNRKHRRSSVLSALQQTHPLPVEEDEADDKDDGLEAAGHVRRRGRDSRIVSSPTRPPQLPPSPSPPKSYTRDGYAAASDDTDSDWNAGWKRVDRYKPSRLGGTNSGRSHEQGATVERFPVPQ